jgi:hypothetical protein
MTDHHDSNSMPLNRHTRLRMNQRGIQTAEIELVLRYGRLVYERSATIAAIGRKEVKHFAELGIDLRDCEGLQVLVGSGGDIITTYRNHDFRSLRARRKRSRPAQKKTRKRSQTPP